MNCVPGMPCWQNTENPDTDCNEECFTEWVPCGCEPFRINSSDVIYSGANLPCTTINFGDNLTLILSKLEVDLCSLGGASVPKTRLLTINGVAQDLSADRTWNVGDLLSTSSYANPTWITSLAFSKITGVPPFITLTSLSAGVGINYNSGTGVITNTAPDQTVGLTAGAGISVAGSYPNFTITNTSPGSGITLTAGTGIIIGGSSPNFTVTNSAPDQIVVLTPGTGINITGSYPNFSIINTAPDQVVSIGAGTGISISGSYPNFNVTNTAPDQVVSLTAGTNITITGSYPNFNISASGTVTPPGGSNGSVQFNNSGVFGGNSNFVYYPGSNALILTGSGGTTVAIGATNTAGSEYLQLGDSTYGTVSLGIGGLSYVGSNAGNFYILSESASGFTGKINYVTDIAHVFDSRLSNTAVIIKRVGTSNPSVTDQIWNLNGFLVQGAAAFPTFPVNVNAPYTDNGSPNAYGAGANSGTISFGSSAGGDANFIPRIDVFLMYFSGSNNTYITFTIERSINGTFSDAVTISTMQVRVVNNVNIGTPVRLVGIDGSNTGNTGATKTATKYYRVTWTTSGSNFSVTTNANWTLSWLYGN